MLDPGEELPRADPESDDELAPGTGTGPGAAVMRGMAGASSSTCVGASSSKRLPRASDDGGADGLGGVNRSIPDLDDSANGAYFLGDPRVVPAAESAFVRAVP